MKLVMGKISALIMFFLIASCQQPETFSRQLDEKFDTHLKNIDPSATLDSLHILWKINLTQRFGRVIDDTIYIRELSKIQMQLINATQKHYKDSINFYQSEIDYMKSNTDSMAKQIDNGDSSRKYGYMMRCAYYITKNSKKIIDSTIIIIDSASKLQFTEIMDSSISQTIRKLN
jgi:hypothetical protein